MNIVNRDLVVAMIGFVKGHMTLDKLKLWLAENVWDLSNSESPLDRMMLGELELALSEYDRAHRFSPISLGRLGSRWLGSAAPE